MRLHAFGSGILAAVAIAAVLLGIAHTSAPLILAGSALTFFAALGFPFSERAPPAPAPEPEPVGVCHGCRWWEQHVACEYEGKCRVAGPWLFENDLGAKWPITTAADYCRDFEPRVRRDA